MAPGDHEFERARFESADRATLRYLGFFVHEACQGLLYFLSLLPLALSIGYFRRADPLLLLALAIGGFYVSAILFLLLLVIAKRLGVRRLVTNQVVMVDSAHAKKFLFASMLNGMMSSSPFRSLAGGLSPLTSYYYRGMGAKMAASVFISSTARIFDPWFLEIREHATVGADALILGHMGDGAQIFLGSVFIGEGAIIGARSIILPDVYIGRHSRLGAGALAVRGTVIPDGETWAGVPARRVSNQVRVVDSLGRA